MLANFLIIVIWKGIHFGSVTTGLGLRFILLLFQAAVLPDCDSIESTSGLLTKIIRPHAPCASQCLGHNIMMWPAVCSGALHSQLGEAAKPHLCMDK